MLEDSLIHYVDRMEGKMVQIQLPGLVKICFFNFYIENFLGKSQGIHIICMMNVRFYISRVNLQTSFVFEYTTRMTSRLLCTKKFGSKRDSNQRPL
jgi:hypothetical protein